MLILRRPKMLLRGTMRKFATPSVITVMPVSMASCGFVRWNSAPKRGNMGAMDSAPVTEIQVKRDWAATAVTVRRSVSGV
jgi:hypothetical protein